MFSEKQSALKLSKSQEARASRLYNSLLAKEMPLWEEDGPLSSEAIASKKEELWNDVRVIAIEEEAYTLSVTRLEQGLTRRYGKNVGALALEIPFLQVTQQELTNLLIRLEKMWVREAGQEEVIAEIMPYVERNDVRMRAKIEAEKQRADELQAQVTQLKAMLAGSGVRTDDVQKEVLEQGSVDNQFNPLKRTQEELREEGDKGAGLSTTQTMTKRGEEDEDEEYSEDNRRKKKK